MCAGTDVAMQGSCSGDSGGPLMIKNRIEHKCNKNIVVKVNYNDISY